MKNCTILLCFLIVFTHLLSAQVPQSMQYQAVIRDGSGKPLISTPVQFRFSVESNGGQLFYQETQSTVTNALGGINLVIGSGNVSSGNFQSIDWKSGGVQIRVEMDPAGGSNFAPFGTNSMQSVPYALYAQKANSLDDDAIIDPSSLGSGGADIGQVLIWNGNEWGPGDDSDQQTLTINGNQLSISNGNAVVLPSGSGGGDDWGDQTIETNNTLDGDGTFNDPLKIAQQGAVNGEVLKWNGSIWTPGDDNSTTYTAGNGISINGNNVITNTGDGDASATNEIQTLSINGNQLSLTNGGTVTIPAGNYTQGTGINIAANVISALNTQNLWNANKIQNFNVSTATPSGGQILKWNPDQLLWIPSADNGQNYNGGTGITIAGSSISAQNTQELWNANQLRTFNIVDVAPLDGQVLKYVSTAGGWTPQSLTPTYWQANGIEIYFSQNVGIGTTNPESRLHVVGGSMQIEDQTMVKDLSTSIAFSSYLIPQVDDLKALGTSTRRWSAVYATDGTINTSDAREKKNITPLQYGLEEVLKLKPVSFEWKNRNDGITKLGLIAQDLETVIPEVVAKPSIEDPEGADRLGVYYSDLIPVLIKAIQEQDEKIRLLQEEIALLKK